MPSHPDAELLQLGAEFELVHLSWQLATAEARRLALACDREWGTLDQSIDRRERLRKWDQIKFEVGLDTACSIEHQEFERTAAITKRIRETSARTFAGLAVKARALRFDTYLSGDQEDWAARMMAQFIAELERLAASE